MKIALYFDCQNVSHVFLRDVISYCQNERYEIIIKKAYKDFTKHCGWDEILHASDIESVQVFSSKPNCVDVSLCLDALDDALVLTQLDAVGIVSSDCDFTPLIIKLKKLGKTVLGFGEQKTKQSVKDAYSNFILLHRQTDKTCDIKDIIRVVEKNICADGYICNAKIINLLQKDGCGTSPADYGFSSWKNFYESNSKIFKINRDVKSDIAVALA